MNTNTEFLQFSLGSYGTNCVLIFPENSDKAVLIDAPETTWVNIKDVLKKKGKILEAVFITHPHFDHILGVKEIQDNTNCKIYASKNAKELIENPSIQKSFLPSLDLQAAKVTDYICDKQEIVLDAVKYVILDTPGHCVGSVGIYLPDEKIFFAGDVIFQSSVGRTDLPGGDFNVLASSIKNKIYTLPEDTLIVPGHGPSTNVGAEKNSNPYVRA